MTEPQSVDNNVIKRIQSILNKRNSLKEMIKKATSQQEVEHLQNEFEVAASLAFKILQQHQLTEDAIKSFSFNPKNINFELFNPADYGLPLIKPCPAQHTILYAWVAFNFNLRAVSFADNNMVQFAGFEEDRKAAILFTAFLMPELDMYADKFFVLHQLEYENISEFAKMFLPQVFNSNMLFNKDRTNFIINWYKGCLDSIHLRLEKERKEVLSLASNSTNALVFIGTKQKAVEEFMQDFIAKKNLKEDAAWKDNLFTAPENKLAYGSGRIHGNSMDLNKTKKLGE